MSELGEKSAEDIIIGEDNKVKIDLTEEDSSIDPAHFILDRFYKVL